MRGHASNGKGGLERPKSQKELPSLEPRGLPEQQERAAPKSLLIHKRWGVSNQTLGLHQTQEQTQEQRQVQVSQIWSDAICTVGIALDF